MQKQTEGIEMPDSYDHHERRHGPSDRSLRAADRDREAVADILRQQHAAGRLEMDEFQERVDRCYAAKTYADLDGIVADLPGEDRTYSTPRPWRWAALALLPLLIAVIALSSGHLFWPAIPLLFFFVARPLLWRSGGHRFGWGLAGCGARRSTPPANYA
jgi:hypothetical protein